MGTCLATLQQMGVLEGSRNDGFLVGDKFISYFQVESALLEYPKVTEAGVIALCEHPRQETLKVYLALEAGFNTAKELQDFCTGVADFLREHFSLKIPIHVQLRDKLPMTRSGKILRSVLLEWN